MAALLAYSWPGNVRELRNVIERAMILARGPTLHIKLGHPSLRPQIANTSTGTLDEVEREHILAALERCGWRIRGANAAAELLGVKPTTLESRIKKLGLVQKH
jgi:formate hydrogenlyase transcriptional activator